jgi:hypothetical protein
MGDSMSLQEAGLAWVAIMVAIIFVYGLIQNAKDVAYWRGRHDGWTMHRRMIQNKTDADIN